MASLDLTRSRLLTLKEDARRLLSLCRRNPSPNYDDLVTSLGHFDDVVVDLRAILNGPDYKARSDVDHITAKIEGVALDATADLRLLHSLLLSLYQDPSALKDFANQLHKHSNSLQKFLDQISGREDWSRLTLNVSNGGMKKPKGVSSPRSPGLKVSFTDSTSSGSRTAPPSPYVEDVPDIGEDETSHPVETYHVDPPLFPDAGLSVPAQQRSTPSPPRVIVRSPTDPKSMETEVRPLNFDSPTDQEIHHPHTFHESKTPTQPEYPNTGLDSSLNSLSSSSRSQSKDEIEAEIHRLTAEIARLKTPSSPRPSSSRRSSNYSVDAAIPADQYMRPPRTTRPRASTATGAESRPIMRPTPGAQNDFARYGKSPYASPRYSPMTPPMHSSAEPTARAEDRRYDNKRPAAYRPGPADSLPTFLESGDRMQGLGVGFDGEPKRKSWAADEFFNLFNQPYAGPDPPLFGTGAEPGSPKTARTSLKDPLPRGVTQKKLPVTLEDICLGANKKVRFKRRVPDDMGIKLVEDTKILTVQIFPGLKPGSRIKHPGEGDYNHETGALGEVWFLLDEQRHHTFERRDRDLHMQIQVPLADALCGWSKTVRSICGKEVKVKHAGPTPAAWKEAYAGLGMPKYDRSNKDFGRERGDMVVEVKVVMPPRLEEWQKGLIRQAIGGGSPRRY